MSLLVVMKQMIVSFWVVSRSFAVVLCWHIAGDISTILYFKYVENIFVSNFGKITKMLQACRVCSVFFPLSFSNC